MISRLHLLIGFIGITSFCFSNNIVVSSVSLSVQNTVSDYTIVKFNLSWDNSWRTSTLESNRDAAWVFLKWRKQGQTTWNHATLNTTGHTAPTGSTIDTPTDGKGVFIYKNANGIGSNNWANVLLRWNYGTDGLADNSLVEVYVFAIEMVYIPQAAFYVGDGSTTTIRGHFEAATSGVPFQISSEGAITLGGGGAGSLGNNNTTGMEPTGLDDFNDVTSKSLPAAFPKGYNDFYIMKYEVTQEQYVQFLNKLTYTQQAARTVAAPSAAPGTGALSNTNRNGIDIQISGVNATTPAVYACNLDADANYSESVDGQTIGCNWLHFADLQAYMDWAALRPITELEYEKACRGTLTPIADEYAWGTKTISGATGLSNIGAVNEIASNAGANCVYGSAASVQGPMRVGSFSGTDRESSGASYYGVMDLSGNLREMMITVGNTTGRAFTGVDGDGAITAAGEANVTNWPSGFTADGSNAVGAGYRGMDWDATSAFLRVSCRSAAAYPYKFRDPDYGIRGGRTAP
jgi:formylglycine-generating enzyme required for sulfatase activity